MLLKPIKVKGVKQQIKEYYPLGQAHRKHAYQIMANELGMSHVVVSLIYMALQLAISLEFIYLCPNTEPANWSYLVVVGIILVGAYIILMKKYDLA